MNWLRKHDVCLDLTNLIIHDKDNRGLYSSGNISLGEVILAVPWAIVIRPDSISELEEKITSLCDKSWKSRIFLAISMLEKRNGKYYNDWFNTLPKDLSRYPMFFTAEEREYLKGSSILVLLDKDREIIERIYKEIIKLHPKLKIFSFEDLLSYCTIIESRQFSLDVNECCIAPYLDMANCAVLGKENTTWEFDKETQCFQYKAICNIKKGEPVTYIQEYNRF